MSVVVYAYLSHVHCGMGFFYVCSQTSILTMMHILDNFQTLIPLI